MAIQDITEQARSRKGPPCSVCEALETLAEPEAQALRSLLEDRTWRYSALSEALASEGVELAAFSLSRHARGKCGAREKLR